MNTRKFLVGLTMACLLIGFSVPVFTKADADVDAQFSVVQILKNDISSLVSQLVSKLASLQTELDSLHTLVNSKLSGGSSGGSLATNLDHYYILASNSDDTAGSDNGVDSNITYNADGANFTGSYPSKITLPTPITMPANLTVAAKIKYNYTGGTQPIFGDSNATITSFWYFFVTGHHLSMIYETPSGSRGYETTAELIDGNPHCVSITQVGTSAPVFYLDGAAINSIDGETQGSNGKPAAQGSAIGELGNANFLWWGGAINHLAQWSRSLSASEEAQYNSNGCSI